MAEERILDVLIPPAKNNWGQAEQQQEPSAARQTFRKKLREGQLDDKEIEINLAAAPMGVEIMAPPGMGRDDQPVAVYVPEPGRSETETA
ncbi:heat shock protein [Salmonella enterica subsp. enterica]|uniref:Heat shock protein n=1 Tax=Salmonella enterica I TaxID=59201 RepID=A0A447TQT3_SALET|nr:heat shock protein [Salmonella enterica subsp. enterica]